MSIGVTIKGLLDEGGISYKQSGKSYILSCPRCFKRDKLYIRKSDGRFVCWVCKETEGFSGSPEWALTEVLGLPIPELRKALYGTEQYRAVLMMDLALTDFFDEGDDIPINVNILTEIEPDPDFRELDTPAGEAGRLYLESRGISLEIAKEYGIKAWPVKNRIVFPCLVGGKLVGWQDRYIGPTKYVDEETQVTVNIPKAITSAGLKRDRVLLFGDRITGDHAILTEGPFDALKAHLCGGNVATLGKAVSRTQLNLLKMSGIKKLYLALDPDAFVEATKVLSLMVDEMDIYDMRPPAPYEDLGDMPMDEVRKLMQSAPKVDRNYLFLYLKNHYDYLNS